MVTLQPLVRHVQAKLLLITFLRLPIMKQTAMASDEIKVFNYKLIVLMCLSRRKWCTFVKTRNFNSVTLHNCILFQSLLAVIGKQVWRGVNMNLWNNTDFDWFMMVTESFIQEPSAINLYIFFPVYLYIFFRPVQTKPPLILMVLGLPIMKQTAMASDEIKGFS